MGKLRKLRSSMSGYVIGALVLMTLVFGCAVSVIGYYCFVNAFKDEYANVTYHMADSAAVFVHGDHINDYLNGERMTEYYATLENLDLCCRKLNVSLIYIIKVDRSDYGSFISIFNCVNNSVGDTNYSPWELGYKRATTNAEYSAKYRAIYEKTAEHETVFRLNTTDGQTPHITTLVPVKNERGDVNAILCIQRPVKEMTDAYSPYFSLILLGVFLMMAALSFVTAAFLRKSVIAPIAKVSDESTRFAKERTIREPLGDISRFEVMKNLARSIDSLETDMVNYIEDLTAVTAEKERIGAELSIAATIQKSTLPDVFPAFPDRHEFDIYASMTPAKEVGGDFYNYVLIDDDHLALVMADVSGKGIPAALFMMVSNILISDRALMGGTPAEILNFVNEAVCKNNRAEMFVTVWLGILEISTGRLTFANAGHEYPVICRKGGAFELVKDKHGFVVGGMEGVRYKNQELLLGRGDKLFLYTDGLPEATAGSGEMFTVDRMVRALNEHVDETPKEILTGVEKSVGEFVGDAPQFDDLTMLCIELKDDPG